MPRAAVAPPNTRAPTSPLLQRSRRVLRCFTAMQPSGLTTLWLYMCAISHTSTYDVHMRICRIFCCMRRLKVIAGVARAVQRDVKVNDKRNV